MHLHFFRFQLPTSISTTARQISLPNILSLDDSISSSLSTRSAAGSPRGSSSAIGDGRKMAIVNHIHDLQNTDRCGTALNKLANSVTGSLRGSSSAMGRWKKDGDRESHS